LPLLVRRICRGQGSTCDRLQRLGICNLFEGTMASINQDLIRVQELAADRSLSAVLIERMRCHWLAQVIALWGLSGLVVLGSGFAGANYLTAWRGWGEGVSCCFAAGDTRANELSNVLLRWDSGYYLKIATEGYSPQGDERGFFPLYPFVVKGLVSVFGWDTIGTGLVIAALSFLAAGMGLYALVRDFSNAQLALITIAGTFFFPGAFYMFAFYAEPLLLALSIAALVLARRGRFVASGALIALASASRPTGYLLAIPYLLEFIHQRKFNIKRVVEGALGLAIAASGTIVVLAFIIPFENQGWRFWAGYSDLTERVWKSYLTWPWVTLYDGVMAATLSSAIASNWFMAVSSMLNLLCLLFLFASCVALFRRIPLSLYGFLLGATIYFLCVHGPYSYALDALPKRAIVIYSIYLFPSLALYTRSKRLWRLWMIGSAVGLAFLTAWFASGRWVS
jgi:Gpi18-like mannosyltransferase